MLSRREMLAATAAGARAPARADGGRLPTFVQVEGRALPPRRAGHGLRRRIPGRRVTRVVGIVLVRDEDLYVEQAVRNVSGFCDELILVDNRSRDRTPEILERLADELPHASLHRVKHPSVSHDLIAPLAGEDVWIFGVDGSSCEKPFTSAEPATSLPRLMSNTGLNPPPPGKTKTIWPA